MGNKFIFSKTSAFSLIFLMLFSLFSVGVRAQDAVDIGAGADETTRIGFVFNEEYDAGWLKPDSRFYFFDFTHTPGEALAEAKLMADKGNLEAYQKAIDNFNGAIAEEKDAVEEISLQGVTIDTIESNEGALELQDAQVKLLTYEDYIKEEIESVLNEKAEEGEITREEVKDVIDESVEGIADFGFRVEERRLDLVDEVKANSGVSEIEVEIRYQDSANNIYKDVYGGQSQRISRTKEVLGLKVEITKLKEELKQAEESGDTETINVVENLLSLAGSHGVKCLGADEKDLDIVGFGHLSVAEKLVSDAEKLFNKELDVSELAIPLEDLYPRPYVEIKEEIIEEAEDAKEFLENDYEDLKGRYANDPRLLAVIDREKIEAEKIKNVGENVDGGIIEKLVEGFEADGLGEGEINEEIDKIWISEKNIIEGEDFIPPGLYGVETKNDEKSKEGGPNPEIRAELEIVNRIDENGLINREIVGVSEIADLHVVVEGGIVQEFNYKGDRGVEWSAGKSGYSYTTKLSTIPYIVLYTAPEGGDTFEPNNLFYTGDEKYSYPTEDGRTVIYTATGYEITDADGKVVEENAYVGRDKFVVLGSSENGGYGGTIDFEPDGLVVTNVDGAATKWQATPELIATIEDEAGEEDKVVTYYNPVSGKVLVSDVAPHEEIVYDGTNYVYNYGGVEWKYGSEEEAWTSELGAIPVVRAPAPIGLENEGEEGITTIAGAKYIYNPATYSWTLPDGRGFTPSVNNRYSPDLRNVGYWDANGEFYSSDGFVVRDSYSGTEWSYDPEGTWKSSDGIYNPKEGTITKSDGKVVRMEDVTRDGSGCWGCYKASSGEWTGVSYAGYSGNYVYDPARSTYAYVNPNDNYYSGYKPGDTYSDFTGVNWFMDFKGVWKDSGERTFTGDDGKQYSYDSSKGWVDENGNPTSAPTLNGAPALQPGSVYSYAAPVRYDFRDSFAVAEANKNFNYYDKSTGGVYNLPTGIGPNQEGVDYSQYKVNRPQGWSNELGEGYFDNSGKWTSAPGSGMYGPAGTYDSFGSVARTYAGNYYATGSADADAMARVAGYSDAGAAAAAMGYGGYSGYSSQGNWVPDQSNPNGGYYVGGSPSGYVAPGSYGGGAAGQYSWSLGPDGTTWVGTDSSGNTITGSQYASQQAAGTSGSTGYMPPSSGGYYDSSGAYVVSGSGTYTGTTSGSYTGGYPSGSYYDSSGSSAYGGSVTYGGSPESGGSYSGSYSGSGGSYTGGTSGGESGGTYSGSTSGGTTSGSSTSSGSTSGSTSGSSSGGEGGSTGGSTGGESGGGGTTGGVIADENIKIDNWFMRFWKKWFGS